MNAIPLPPSAAGSSPSSSGPNSPTNPTSPTSSSKRALSRQYKDAPPAMGVYAIRHLASGRVYLGASLNLDGAMNRDRFELNQKCHRHKALLRDWRAFGPEAFAFEVVDTLKRRDEPAIDYKPELAGLLALWTEEFQQRGEIGYPAGR